MNEDYNVGYSQGVVDAWNGTKADTSAESYHFLRGYEAGFKKAAEAELGDDA